MKTWLKKKRAHCLMRDFKPLENTVTRSLRVQGELCNSTDLKHFVGPMETKD